MNEFMTWLAQQNPAWIFMIFPLIVGSIALSCWRDHLKNKKRERMPHTMTDNQYLRFNYERFKK